MRRQTQPQGLAVRWGMGVMDLDPHGLPARYSLPVVNGEESGREARDVVEICDGFISVKHEVSGQKTVVRAFSLDEFDGISIRVESLDDLGSEFAVSVNLHHADPKLCFPLHIAFNMDLAAERWHGWSRALNLPLLLPTANGGWREPFERFGKLTVYPACERSPRRVLAGRRSNYSSVREAGNPNNITHVQGAELIARN